MRWRCAAALPLLCALAACTAPGGGSSAALAPQTHASGSQGLHSAGAALRATHAALIFADEFTGDTLDASKWNTCYWWAQNDECTNGGKLEREYYTPQNVSVHGGRLDLEAVQQYVDPAHEYTSGMVSTNDCCGRPITFEFEYGYMEMRAKLPPGRGMWPAFWLVPANHTWPPEIDAMEWQGQKPRTNFLTIHWGTSRDPQQSGTSFVGPNMSAGYHTYGLDWESTNVTWYEDGKAIRTYTDAAHIPNLPMVVILNLAIGGWLGYPDKHTVFPAHMLVDYVRVWDAYPY